MTTPRITRTGTCRAAGREVDIVGLDALCVALLATSDETEDARALAETGQVRITIEPADVQPEPPPPGSALDYLAEAKALLNQTLDRYAVAGETDADLRRCLSLMNTAHLAILSERMRRP